MVSGIRKMKRIKTTTTTREITVVIMTIDHPLFVLQIVQIDLFKVLLGMPLVYLL